MKAGAEALPDDVEALKAALIVARAEAAAARAQQSDDQALIAHLKLQIEKLNRDRYGPRSERTARLLDQLELTLEELESAATEDELAAEIAAAKTKNTTTTVASFTRMRPSRQPFPDHLPRERVIVPGPVACSCCGGSRLSRLGEDITETLEVIPKSWKVIQHVREKFSCRDCEKITQAPAPFHVIARGWAGPSLLAMVLFEKFGQHQPLNRQAERYAKEGVPISLSTLADQVGGCTAVLMPLFKRLEAYVLSAERLHGDDIRVPVLAKGKTDTGRIWVYVRDDKPFGGPAPPGAVFYYSRDRAGKHPQAHLANYTGIFQADAYEGYGKLYEGGRAPGLILEAACWVHARRPFFVMADLAENARRKAQGKKPAVISPLALEAVRRIDELFEIERAINGQSPERRRAVRQELSAPLVANLEAWMREQRAKLSRGNDVAKAMDYMLKRWTAFTRFLDDGRICLSNNAAERGVRGIALGRKSWLFCGSDRGGERAAVMYSLIVTAKMNDIDPQAWLADVLARIADHPVQKLDELLPWNWRQLSVRNRQAA
ncbi:transposase [Bradyrhizobium japonicum]|uniref:Transposase n=1 Tax=Bradyrhizobium diazoefficiens TaxID=1355477 RepID=A0A809XY03_9BRAD|nr:IS66 family transposase [Bradyrhizobium diazoefficiens]MBP1063409.1 transposase [Bradyrhizobium japonicum]BCA06181.1 transposase [Bradyrhizobium diazoefficiens]BCA23533.1 transposase [Bradyrhizobium diazoefficiens]BCE32912.1 transposase [Bradyrhizobium diazoefficiens]BCE41690.1 transposase [Bradyrhizobium diazoefficiens]